MVRLGNFTKQGYKDNFSKGELTRELVCMNNDYDNLKKENKQLKEQLNKYTDPKDLTLMFMYCDEKAKDKIKCLEQENQQLKEQLEQKEDIIDKVIKWIENDYYSMNTTDIDSIFVRNNKLVQIRKFLKGDK